jgi:nicotinamidase-related amidase
VVDAQVDFMDPGGRLYVKDLGDPSDPGSVQIVGTLERAVAWMREHCDALVFTGDWHGMDDEEIDAQAPDPTKGTYPPHCMGRSEDPAERAGAEVIEEIRPLDAIVLPVDADPVTAKGVAERAVVDGCPVFIRKKRFDVFVGNSATEAFLEGLQEQLGAALHFVVVGVARDVCVTQAVDGMLARDYAVTALSDATWGLGLEAEEVTLARWARGGTVTTLSRLLSERLP